MPVSTIARRLRAPALDSAIGSLLALMLSSTALASTAGRIAAPATPLLGGPDAVGATAPAQSAQQSEATPAGRWQGKADSPDGPIAFTMSLVVDGDTVTGEIALPEGVIKIEGGRWAGGELSFTIVHPSGDTISARAKLEGDVLTGEWSGAQGGSGTWQAQREPARR
ncbi:MAG TPA: hypothetical protein VNI83_04995 [Vicinamibacterales bacterium]|nr:hypothetical protein [Vicinamibacterales bacterium]